MMLMGWSVCPVIATATAVAGASRSVPLAVAHRAHTGVDHLGRALGLALLDLGLFLLGLGGLLPRR